MANLSRPRSVVKEPGTMVPDKKANYNTSLVCSALLDPYRSKSSVRGQSCMGQKSKSVLNVNGNMQIDKSQCSYFSPTREDAPRTDWLTGVCSFLFACRWPLRCISLPKPTAGDKESSAKVFHERRSAIANAAGCKIPISI